MPSDLSIHLNPVLPGWLVGAIAIALLVAVAWAGRVLRRKRLPRRWVVGFTVLRLVAVAVFLVGLLQPLVGFTRTTRPKPELAVVIDTSRSMGLADGDQSRLDRATNTLRDGPFAEHLKKNYVVRWYAAGPNAAGRADLTGLEATGDTTRLADALRGTVEQARADVSGPKRILLVSDGTDHGSTDPAAAAAALGVPVDVLPVGSAGKPDAAVAIAEVQASSRVLVGSDTRFLVVARGRPTPAGRTLTVHLSEDGQDVLTLPIEIPAGRAEGRVELSHRPAAAGVKRFTLRLSGPATVEAEYPVNIQVIDRAHEVLMLEDTWRWEFKFLRRAVEEDPSFRFTAILARGPATVMQFGSPDRKARLLGLPQTSNDLAPFDLFLLGDVNPARWPRGLAAAISRAVTEEGKSLVLQAGPNLGKLAADPDMHALLPVELGSESGTPAEGEIDVRPPDAEAASFFIDPQARGKVVLPPLERVYPPIRKRPGARVILEATKLANSYGPVIVMAEQTVGRGRVVFVGTDTLWQWQTLAMADDGPSPHRAYWQRLLRTLAPAKPIGDGGLTLLPDRTRVEAGKPVSVWAVARGPSAAGAIAMGVVLPDDKRTTLAAIPDPAQPGHWRATFTPTKPGTYHVNGGVRVDGQPGGEATTTLEVTAGGELTDTMPDADMLGRIAQASGGHVIDPANPTSWPTDEPQPVARRRTADLWGDGVLLVLLIAVLGIDWLLRLIRGYV